MVVTTYSWNTQLYLRDQETGQCITHRPISLALYSYLDLLCRHPSLPHLPNMSGACCSASVPICFLNFNVAAQYITSPVLFMASTFKFNWMRDTWLQCLQMESKMAAKTVFCYGNIGVGKELASIYKKPPSTVKVLVAFSGRPTYLNSTPKIYRYKCL